MKVGSKLRLRPQFSLKWLVLAIATIAALTAIPHWYRRFFAVPTLVGEFHHCSVARADGELPYRLGGHCSYRLLGSWIRESHLVPFPGRYKFTGVITVVDYSGRNVAVFRINPVASGKGNVSIRDQSLFEWNGQVRSGNYAALKQILDDTSAARDNCGIDGFGATYEDSNGDGSIDIRRQSIDLETALVWHDSDADGFFDEEYFFDYIKGAAYSRHAIHMRVPTVAERE